MSTLPRAADVQSAKERIVEIGQILALGLIRLRARQSRQSSAPLGESSLACVGEQSGHANPAFEGEADHA